jgi:hypothetical protein
MAVFARKRHQDNWDYIYKGSRVSNETIEWMKKIGEPRRFFNHESIRKKL